MNRILFLAQKEFTQIMRDWRTLALTLVLPLAVLLLFGYAITLDIREVPMAVVDQDHTPTSRNLVERFIASDYFKVMPAGHDQATEMLETREAKLALIIPSDFEYKVGKGVPVAVQLLADGSDSNSSSIGLSYTTGVLQEYAFDRTIAPIVAAGLVEPRAMPPIDFQPRVRFNPALDSTAFIVPGLVAIIMMITVVILSSLSIVKERELGTLETIMVSPLRRSEFILGKLLPYFTLGFADLFIIVGAGVILFHVPFRGSFLTLVLLSGLFIMGGLGMGLFISTLADTQRTAWMISLLSTLLPSFLLSGFLFPIRMMPPALRLITYAVPVRYYLIIVRGIILKGAGVADLKNQVFALTIFTILMISLSVARFRKKV